MTEPEWLTTTDVDAMLALLARRRKRLGFNSERFRTFAVGCARRMWPYLGEPLRELVKQLDCNPADVDQGVLRQGRVIHETACVKYGEDYTLASANVTTGLADYRCLIELSIQGPARLVAGFLALRWPRQAALAAARNGPLAAAMAEGYAALPVDRRIDRDDFLQVVQPRSRSATEFAAQAELLRCIFGNPFRPVAFDPSWRTEAVVGLARGIDEANDFAALPVLADALEDAGCADADLLAHCRRPGPHARGCHVVDHVLGNW
ncbi:MAG: hypothetical protein U0804_10580 [Gemmataceae bacterium]